MLRLWRDLPISRKLPAIICAVGILATVVAGVVGYRQARASLEKEAESRLLAILVDRQNAVMAWFQAILGDLQVQRQNPLVLEMIRQYHDSWREMGGDVGNSLQHAYIEANPHPVGHRENLDDAGDGTPFSKVHARYHPWMRTFLRDRGYYDIFLIDTDGNIVYTVFKELDFATNVLSGRWKDTDIAAAFVRARDATRNDATHFLDFRPYAPSNDAPAAFVSTRIEDPSGAFAGVLVFQLPVERMDLLMQQNAGLGTTGESYLVGPDNLMRSNSLLTEAPTLLAKKVDTAPARDALAGEQGVMVTTDADGREVVSAYTHLQLGDTRWAVLVEQGLEETFAGALTLRDQILWVILAGLAVFGAAGILFGRGIAQPIARLTDTMRSLAGGDTSVAIPGSDRGDELGAMAGAVAVFRDGLIEARALREAQDAERREAERRTREAVRAMADRVEEETIALVARVANSTDNMLRSTRDMAGSAREVQDNATSVAASAEESVTNMRSMADTAEQIALSIRDVAAQVRQSQDLSREAVQAGEHAGATIESLSRSVDTIGAVAGLIAEIAEQSHLLALNATIEAAHAGEAGRGFTIVANEVKSLATETAKSTREIERQIRDIQQSTSAAVSAFSRISGSIRSIDAVATRVNQAVGEQDVATQGISRNVRETQVAAQEVARMIVNVSGEARRSGAKSGELESAVAEVSNSVSELQHSLVRIVRTSTALADRRGEPRTDSGRGAEISANGVGYRITLVNLSNRGARIRCADGEFGDFRSGTLLAPDGRARGFEVRARSATEASVAFV